jgi:hypothetical protein
MIDKKEIINKYIDNELTIKEIEETNKLINNDSDFKKNITTQKYVHETLYQIPLKSAPQGFTNLVMNKILNRISEKYKKNYFFRLVIAIFGVLLIVTLFFFFYFFTDLAFVQSSYKVVNNYTSQLLPIFNSITQLVKTDIFKIVTGMVSFIFFLGFYFNLNFHNNFKKQINKY